MFLLPGSNCFLKKHTCVSFYLQSLVYFSKNDSGCFEFIPQQFLHDFIAIWSQFNLVAKQIVFYAKSV